MHACDGGKRERAEFRALEEEQEKLRELQKRTDELQVRTLSAEDKVGKLTKELQGTKKMLETLMDK